MNTTKEILDSSKLTKADLRRLEDLNLQMTVHEKKLASEKEKLRKEKFAFENERKKLETEKKEIKIQQIQLQNEKKFLEEKDNFVKRVSNTPNGNKSTDDSELKQVKKNYEHAAKGIRDAGKRIDQLEAENKILKRKLQNAASRKGPTNDKQLKALMKENRDLKKKLKALLKELNRQKRWYTQAIKVFKESQNKWLQKQIQAVTDKQIVIRFMFVDDIKQIRAIRPSKTETQWKSRIHIRDAQGGETVLKDIEFEILDKDEDGENSKTNKSNKNNKDNKQPNSTNVLKTNDYNDEEIENYMNEFMQEFNIKTQDNNDLKDSISEEEEKEEEEEDDDFDENNNENILFPEKFTDALNASSKKRPEDLMSVGSDGHNVELEAQIMNLIHEIQDRNEDLKNLQNIVQNHEEYPNPKEELEKIFVEIQNRHDSLENSLKEINFDMKQLENTGNQWEELLKDVSNLILNGRVDVAKLVHFYEHFLKELKGRLQDLAQINSTYYNPGLIANEEKNDQKNGFELLKKNVDDRHLSIQDALLKRKSLNEDTKADVDGVNEMKMETNENSKEIQEILDNFSKQNDEWNNLIHQSSTRYDSSITVRTNLVSTTMNHLREIERLVANVNQLPSDSLQIENINNRDDVNNNNNEPNHVDTNITENE